MSKDLKNEFVSITISKEEMERLGKMTREEFMIEYMDKKIKEAHKALLNERIRLELNDGTGKLGKEDE